MTNPILAEQDSRFDLSIRLKQLFLDADELASDLTQAAQDVFVLSLDFPANTAPDGNGCCPLSTDPNVIAAQNELVRLRGKVRNIVYDFREHYDNDIV